MFKEIISLKEIIPSYDVRECIEINNWLFQDYEYFVLIQQNPLLSMQRKHDLLQTLFTIIENEKLRKAIDDCIKYEQETCTKLTVDDNNTLNIPAVYMVSIYVNEDNQYYDNVICSSLKTAIDYGREMKSDFYVKKIKLINDISETTIDADDDITNYETGRAYFNDKGELLYAWHNGMENPASKNSMYRENMAIKVPNPFKRGDIVRIYDRYEEYGVVETSEENWAKLCNICDNTDSNFYDKSLVVQRYDNREKRFYHEHIIPFLLEKVDESLLEDKYSILKSASYLLKEENSLDFFLIDYDDRKSSS